ncbi:hypothetical protein F5B21DRAFT_508947 [Xylaria acuta]|nr:hypothetical protein F5B21DRAFT_508947 [Xylaria acuta]
MHFSAVSLLGLVATAVAWDVTMYEEPGCESDSDGKGDYFIYTGSGDRCVAVGDHPSGVECRHYYNGGSDNGPCDSQFTAAKSLFIYEGDCQFSYDATCDTVDFSSMELGLVETTNDDQNKAKDIVKQWFENSQVPFLIILGNAGGADNKTLLTKF